MLESTPGSESGRSRSFELKPLAACPCAMQALQLYVPMLDSVYICIL